ncbi:MAG: rhodanese-like domain-containing protein [Myxococcota bacterium]
MSDDLPPDHPEVWEVPPQQVKQWLDEQRDMVLLDCRNAHEHALAHIDGARLVPMDEIAARLEELREFEDQMVVVYCHHGRRSMNVTMAMRRYGFPNVKSMTGGIHQWSQEIDPAVPQYDKSMLPQA